MGNHQVVWFSVGTLSLAALVHGPATDLRPGMALRFSIDTARCTLFDRASGQRL
jgi:hypothetical protein